MLELDPEREQDSMRLSETSREGMGASGVSCCRSCVKRDVRENSYLSHGRERILLFRDRLTQFSPSTFVFALLHVFCVSDADIHLVSVYTLLNRHATFLMLLLFNRKGATGRRRVRCDVRDKPRKAFGLVGFQLERPHLSRSCASLSDKFRLHVDVELPRPSMAQCG